MQPLRLIPCLSIALSVTAFSQSAERPLAIGGDVLPPKLVKQVDPRFTRKMRKAIGATETLVHLVVDEKGLPVNVSVKRSGGEAFDKEAMEAVRQYRFEPATRDGKPVAVELNVAVNFQIIQK